jgi:DNA-directed RNA polymerase subunit RPC12/RpoP
MTDRDDEVPSARCPYCQGDALTRLVESDALPVDVFRCSGCGTQFNIDRLRGDEPPEELSMPTDD